MKHALQPLFYLLLFLFTYMLAPAQERSYEVDSLTLDGATDGKSGQITISANIGGLLDPEVEPKLIYSVDTQSNLEAMASAASQSTALTVEVQHGELQMIELNIKGDLTIEKVSGENIAAWSIRSRSSSPDSQSNAAASKQLVITLQRPIESGSVSYEVVSKREIKQLPETISPLFLSPTQAGSLSGNLQITNDTISITAADAYGLSLLESSNNDQYFYSITGTDQVLNLDLRYARRPPFNFSEFDLRGVYRDNALYFVLTGKIETFYDQPVRIPILSGNAALTESPEIAGAKLTLDQGSYWLEVDKASNYPLKIEFAALVTRRNGQSMANFQIAQAPLQPIQISGLPVSTDRIRLNGAPLVSEDNLLVGSLPGNGVFDLNWTDPTWKSQQAANATLIYSTENIAQVAVRNGLIRQQNDIKVHIMQGSMQALRFDLRGQGSITGVESDAVLRWKLVDDFLDLELNKAYTTDFSIQLHAQQAVGAFPIKAQPLRVVPQSAIRHSGFIKIMNQGAVSIDVPVSEGFAQISPEYFPETYSTMPDSGQELSYRFSDTLYSYTINADNILPEVAVSQILLFNIRSENQSLDAEMELTIREAPLRDFFIQIPRDYALVDLEVANLADYFITEEKDAARTLRLVFRKPVSGRILIRALFENNEALDEDRLRLPAFRAVDVKSVRGHIGVSAESGLRVRADSIEGVSEQAVNFFPKKVKQLQLSLRMRAPEWIAELRIEKLPQSIQADALHLYSVAEGRIYGSSVINYLISGAHVSSYQIQVPAGIQNLDFVGRDIRGWTDLGEGLYEIQLHSAASGAYTLLATYESRFESQGATVELTGVTPTQIDAEQGYVVLVSNFPFALGDISKSPDILRLEPGEIPAEFRLLYDAKELAAFQYSERPMQLNLELRSYEQAQGADQIIDLVELKSHISRDGEILTAVDLMLKSKGETHFRMQLPPEHRIWSAQVAGEKVSPIAADNAILLPLPAGQDPNNAIRIQIELASQAEDANRPVIVAPALFAPSLMVNWELTSDPGYGLRYYDGTISSAEMSRPVTGFAWLGNLLSGEKGDRRLALLTMIFMGMLAIVFTRMIAKGKEAWPLPFRMALLIGLIACSFILIICGMGLGADSARPQVLQDSLSFNTPIELSSQPLTLIVDNWDYTEVKHSLASLWPFIFGIGLWIYALARQGSQQLLWAAGWVVNFLAALHYAASGVLFLVLLMLFFFVHILRTFRIRSLGNSGLHPIWIMTLALALSLGMPQSHGATLVDGDTLAQVVQIKDDFATIDAEISWSAQKDEQILFLKAPANLLSTSELPDGLTLTLSHEADNLGFYLYAEEEGSYKIQYRYQVRVRTSDQTQSEVFLPVGQTLSSRARIEIPDTNISLTSASAVSVAKLNDQEGRNSFYEVVFKPTMKQTFSWSPKKRDTSEEAPVYHVESFDVFTPLSGLVSGFHEFRIRLSQGEMDRLQLEIPDKMTITSVAGKQLANWQFDPATQQLVCFMQSPQSESFELDIFSQYSASTLPYTISVRSIDAIDAASQLSLVAIATDNEVQIGSVQTRGATILNLEDFPAANVQQLEHLGRLPTLRRAYRWKSPNEIITLQALAVQPDIRVISKETISLGEDRALLRAEIAATVNRAGIFKLSLPIPANYDVETVSGSHLSYWNELAEINGARTLQLHLNGKTIGKTDLNISFSGPGLGDREHYVTPILKLDGASRQSGTVALIPELGYRLVPTERKSALELDPAETGMSRQKLSLYRILNRDAALAFSVERVKPWIEVEKLQQVSIRSGLTEVRTRYLFNVENAGIRSQRFQIPTNAIGVQFTGEGVVDASPDSNGNWIVKLNRKMVGKYVIELNYQLPIPDQPETIVVEEAAALDVNQQSGYIALIPQGRIQLGTTAPSDVFQATEAPMINHQLKGDLNVEIASHLYRSVQQGKPLGVRIKRYTIAELIPAQVHGVELNSVISEQGSMLTKVTLKLDPGDKRMLRITLPENSQFWFGFVNQQSVWPWREGRDIFLQLEANPVIERDSTVEFFYATDSITDDTGPLEATLQGPRLDLPLENVNWSINYPVTWDVQQWDGNLTQELVEASRSSFFTMRSYLEYEEKSKLKQKVFAETLLNDANQLLSEGKQQEARQAFSSAYNLSQFDAALNEDARVQLQNVRQEQALVALANRRNSFINSHSSNQEVDASQASVIDPGGLLNYTDQAKQDILRGNTTEENDTLRLLAARLIDQQQAVPGNPQAIQTVLPQQGQMATFTRSLQINNQADLTIELKGERSQPKGTAGFGIGTLLFLVALVGGVTYVSRK